MPEMGTRVSYEQLKTLIDYMCDNVDLASGPYPSTIEYKHKARKFWRRVAITLNSYRGSDKTPVGWKRYWADFKHKVRTRADSLKHGSSSTKQLSELQKRVLHIMEPKGTTNAKKIDTIVPVKVEKSGNESNLYESQDSNGFSSDVDDQDMNDDRGLSSKDESDLIMNCPKWLEEVEKKRAEAEITRARAEEIRARAEESRARVAATNAEAAIMQADALKKMAEAAVIQADALQRIAQLMERRGLPTQPCQPLNQPW